MSLFLEGEELEFTAENNISYTLRKHLLMEFDRLEFVSPYTIFAVLFPYNYWSGKFNFAR